jgi:hypothetical protein
MRGNGLSHVRMATCWEFFTYLLGYRFSGRLKQWRGQLTEPDVPVDAGAVGSR